MWIQHHIKDFSQSVKKPQTTIKPHQTKVSRKTPPNPFQKGIIFNYLCALYYLDLNSSVPFKVRNSVKFRRQGIPGSFLWRKVTLSLYWFLRACVSAWLIRNSMKHWCGSSGVHYLPEGLPFGLSPSSLTILAASGPMSLCAGSCCAWISGVEITSGNRVCFQRHQSNCCKQQKKTHLVFWRLTFCSFHGNAADTSIFVVAKCVKVLGHLLQIAHFMAALNT